MGNSYSSWLVYTSGVVGGNYYDGYYDGYDSYGCFNSPDAFMYYNYTSFHVMEDGSMITYAVEYSYGKLFKYL